MTKFSKTTSSPTCIKVLGCGVEVTTKANKELATFDLDGLRWNKVVICTDADVDGFQIRTLILTMLYRLTPTLIEKGYVYIAESPLYRDPLPRTRPISPTPTQEKAEILQTDGGAESTPSSGPRDWVRTSRT